MAFVADCHNDKNVNQVRKYLETIMTSSLQEIDMDHNRTSVIAESVTQGSG